MLARFFNWGESSDIFVESDLFDRMVDDVILEIPADATALRDEIRLAHLQVVFIEAGLLKLPAGAICLAGVGCDEELLEFWQWRRRSTGTRRGSVHADLECRLRLGFADTESRVQDAGRQWTD